MLMNYNKCDKCGNEIKEDSKLYLNYNQCRNYSKTNVLSKIEFEKKNLSENNIDYNKLNLFKKNGEKKLNYEIRIDTNKKTIINRKKRRISKKIFFNRKKLEINEFSKIIYQIIEEAGKKCNLLLIYPYIKKKSQIICDFCNRTKLNKKYKLFKISCRKDFKEFYKDIFNIITQEEIKHKLSNLSQENFNLILENEKDMINQINKLNPMETELVNKNICLFCIYNSLIKYKGINLLWDGFLSEDGQKFLTIKKKFEIILGLEELLINPNKNNVNKNNENNIKEDNNINTNINLIKKGNLFLNDVNILNEKNLNIFNLILEDEDAENYLIDNNTDETKSIKENDYNEKNSYTFNEIKRKNIIQKSKIKSLNTKIDNNDKLNKNYLNNYMNDISTNHFELSDSFIKNNINKINEFLEKNSEKRNNEQINPLLFDMNYNKNNKLMNTNPLCKSMDYINSNNNIFLKENEQSIYNRLNNQISFLKNTLNLKTNLNNEFLANNISAKNDEIFSLKDINEKILLLKGLIQIILNYMNNIGELSDIYSYISGNTLSVMISIMNGMVSCNDIIQLKNIHYLFSKVLYFNYKIKMMNSELCNKLRDI